MIAYCLAAIPAIRRYKALLGPFISLLLWFGITLGSYVLLAQVVGW